MTPVTIDMNAIVGTHDLALITLDTLRHDVAAAELAAGRTPHLAGLLARAAGGPAWERRHSPGTFTYAAHAAFFAGFLPTPAHPGPHRRLLALGFEGSETIGPGTCVLEGATIVEGLAARGYHTLCVGGTGFFNLSNPLGRALPSAFAEAHWHRALGVTDPRSFENQIAVVEQSLARLAPDRRAFTFVNVAALHQPNHFYLAGGAATDTLASHAAALRYVDAHLPRLVRALVRGAPLFLIVCSDHGTLYGEDGHTGHRVAHPAVTTVPYAEIVVRA
ncbi:MAG TPA: STM4013/SEN3800 family hydrolase [Kofleriaceae bacterium]|nr:STM4013/SEN3800 family hydrolase [Kofleriaceae bacterium]